MSSEKTMEKLVSLCRRRGFIFQSSEIYGGINGFWDYGPMGVELKKNIKEAWWQDMVRNPPIGPDGEEVSMVGVDCSIIMNPKVWEASGHVGGFADPMSNCSKCRKLFRADKVQLVTAKINGAYASVISCEADSAADSLPILEDKIKVASKKKKPGAELLAAEREYYDLLKLPEGLSRPCPIVDCDGTLSEPRAFNLMFDTHTGPIQSEENKAYLRPETAQGMFVNFRNILDSSRVKLPFGIAQIGKAFRNEINPRNYTFRSREFEQMEIEFFCHPTESMKWYQWWRDQRIAWYSKLGIQSERLKPRGQDKEELAHYSIGTTDIEYLFPFSEETQELEGVAHRGNYDLTAHMKLSGKDLSYFDEEAWEKDKATRGSNSFKEWLKGNRTPEEIEKYQFTPHVIEPSAGADRFTLAVICEAFTEDTIEGETRTVMKFHPRLAPIKAAILPLVNKEGMPEKAFELYKQLKQSYNVFYDDKGAVGRRYRRQDEVGTPFCITVDGQTMQDNTVTIRDRDTLVQRRILISEVEGEIRASQRSGG
jgi:glycyl-tRNA synthetase